MIIEKLILHNFGVYEDRKEIKFPNDKKKNIIVFIGKNGSGKTTILEALKLVLYGPLLYGYKSPNDSYLEIIKDKINSKAYNQKKESGLELTFNKIENSVTVTYRIERKWKINSKAVAEKLIIYRENEPLSDVKINILENYFRRFIPPSLIDLFFFDGEKLILLSEERVLRQKMKDSVDIMFNIDIFSQLTKDLNQFLKHKDVDAQLSEEEKKLRNKRDLKEKIETNIEQIKDNFLIEKSNLQELIEQISSLRNELSLFGALEKNELIDLKAHYRELEREKEKLHKEKNELLITLFPFQLSINLIRKLKESVDKEREKSRIQYVKEILTNNDMLKNAISETLSLDEVKLSIEPYLLDKLSEGVIRRIERNIRTNEENELTDFSLTSFMSKKDMELLENINSRIGKNLSTELNHIFNDINKINEGISDLRKKINLNVENTSFEQKFRQLDEKKEEQFRVELKIKEKESEYKIQLQDKMNLEKEIEKLENQIDYISRSNTISSIIGKIIKVSSEFMKESRSQKTQILEKNILSLFNQLIQKDDLLKHIKLLDDYQFIFQNGSFNSVQFKQLSTGEKQVFIIALLWSLINMSKRTFPVVFDSFLGRLDQTHKNKIITKFIPKCQKQVILLANDNEIDTEDIEIFSKLNACLYKLNYNENKKNTSIVEMKL